MAWTTPGTATAGEVLTASFWNTNVRDNLLALPRGLVAEDTSTSTQTLTSSMADITGLSASVTFEQNRIYRITIIIFRNTVAAGTDFRAVIGSTNLDTLISGPATATRSAHIFGEWIYTHSTTDATLTVKAQAQDAGGTSTTLVNSAGFQPHSLRVFDLGFDNF